MPAGDSGELHYLSLETTSDTSHDVFVCGLSNLYHHTRFFFRGAWNYNYAYTFQPYIYFENNNSGSWDTAASYNLAMAYGSGSNNWIWGTNRDSYGRGPLINCHSAGTASWSPNIITWCEGTIWNHNAADKATTITYRSGTQNDSNQAANATYTDPRYSWGWVNYREACVTTSMYWGYSGINMVQGSRMDLVGVDLA